MRRQRVFKLQTRLTILVLVAVLLPFAILLHFVTAQADRWIEEAATERLERTNQATVRTVAGWLEMNERALEQLVALPGVIRMDAGEHKLALEAMAATYPHMNLIGTTDLAGVNVAQSDSSDPADYSHHHWFQSAAAGDSLTYQTLVDPATGEPALVAAIPIRDGSGTPVGVAMYASDLASLADEIRPMTIGDTGLAFIVDDQGQVIAHSDSAHPTELRDSSAEPPVAKALKGEHGQFAFSDSKGTQWLAHVQPLDNGWVVVTQQQETEALQSLGSFQRVVFAGVALAAALAFALVWIITRRMLRPVSTMTRAALAIGQGDLDQTIPVTGTDEFSILAITFNDMASQLRDLISSLEYRVEDRTEELERRAKELESSNRLNQRRAAQLAVSARITHTVASVLDVDRLLVEVVQLISENFGYYHTGIFLVDETGSWAALRAASSQGGQRMLARNHRLRVGEQGIVGYVTSTGRPRLALDVGADAIHFDNPDLPETRSEIALPLVSRNQILGALDVQSADQNAFDSQDIAVLRSLADQVAVALDNARLFETSQAALRQAEEIQRRYVDQAWSERMTVRQKAGLYEYRATDATWPGSVRIPEAERAMAQGTTVVAPANNGHEATVVAPIKVRDQVIGALGMREEGDDFEWSDEQIELIETVADQVGQALEAARLFEDTRRRATRERQTSEISARIRAADDIDDIMRITVHEMRRALRATHGAIKLGTETHLRPPVEEKDGGD